MITINRIIPLFTTLILITLVGCDSTNSKDEQSVSEEEAAEIVASSMATGSSGAVTDIETAIELAEESTNSNQVKAGSAMAASPLDCGSSTDSTFTTHSTGVISHEYIKTYNYFLECDESANPIQLDVSFTYNGEFDAPRLSSQNSGSGDLEVTNLSSSELYLVNGSWQRNGQFASKIRNQTTRQATLQFDVFGVFVDKSSHQIESGTISFNIEGESSSQTKEGSFSYEGTITFSGNGEAVIEINGSKYISNVESGEVEES